MAFCMEKVTFFEFTVEVQREVCYTHLGIVHRQCGVCGLRAVNADTGRRYVKIASGTILRVMERVCAEQG